MKKSNLKKAVLLGLVCSNILAGSAWGETEVKPTASYTDNVIVLGANGWTLGGEAQTGSSPYSNAYGGYSELSGQEVKDNKITVSDDAEISFTVYGGCGNGAVSYNVVNVTGGTVSDIVGGQSYSESIYNVVNISGEDTGDVGFVVGGQSSMVANYNEVFIADSYEGSADPSGTLSGIYGGLVDTSSNPSGVANGNKVVIEGGTYNTTIAGGWAGGTTNDNTVEINGGSVNVTGLIGGAADTSSNNTLILGTKGVQAGMVTGFQNYVFRITGNSTAGSTMLKITDSSGADFNGGTFALVIAPTIALAVDESVTLLDSETDLSTLGIDWAEKVSMSIGNKGEVSVNDDGDLIFTLKGDLVLDVIPTLETSNNEVIVKSATTATINGVAAPACDASSWRNAYGGYSEVSGVEVKNNKITVQGGSYSITAIYGGYGATGASYNSVTVEDGYTGEVTYVVTGGYTVGANNDASNNTVSIAGGTYSCQIYGGEAKYDSSYMSGSANGNKVTISGGSFDSGKTICGGCADGYETGSGNADSNTITITGGTSFGTIYGGSAEGGAAGSDEDNGNTVIIRGSTTGNITSICGGFGVTGASYNTVTIDQTYTGKVEGMDNISVVGGNAESGNATNNTVNIGGGTYSSDVYAGYVTTEGNADKNTLTITGGTFYEVVYGGKLEVGAAGAVGSGEGKGNTVTISSASQEKGKKTGNIKAIYGGHGGSANYNEVVIESSYTGTVAGDGGTSVAGGCTNTGGDANNNTVRIFGGTYSGKIYGGNGPDHEANNNTVVINGGVYNGGVYSGCYICGGEGDTVSNNTVEINDGDIDVTGLFGGNADSDETASNNTVKINGGDINVYAIVGGNVNRNGGTASNNTVEINGGIVNAVGLVGGTVGGSGTVEKNTLILGTKDVQAGMVMGFQNYVFKLTDNTTTGSTMLTVTSGIDFANSSFKLEIDPSIALDTKGQSITLLDYGTDLSSGLIDKFGSVSLGTLSIDGDKLVFTLGSDLVLDVKPTALTGNIVITYATTATINGVDTENCDVSYWRNVYGGYGESDVTNNQVNVNESAVSVYGGYSTSGKVDGNEVIIRDGTHSKVYGGYSVQGNATNNEVYITGGTNSDVYGGYSVGGNATNNTVELEYGAISKVYGGYSENSNADVVTGNTLKISGSDISVGSVNNFASYTFKLTDNTTAGSTMLTATSGIDFANSSFKLEIDPSINLSAGDSVTLLDYSTDLMSVTVSKTITDDKGTITIENGNLVFMLGSKPLILDVKPTNLTGNSVNVTSATTATINGESAPNCDAIFWRNAYGGYSELSGGEVKGNKITVSDDAHISTVVYGGYSENGDASGNEVNVTGGTVECMIGGKSSGEATYNVVNVSGKNTGDVVYAYGGQSNTAANYNEVYVAADYGGNFYTDGGMTAGIFGGIVNASIPSGVANGNKVVIEGGTYSTNIAGGWAGGTTNDNTVEINGGDVNVSTLAGGAAGIFGGTSSNNTLILGTKDVQAGTVAGFQNYVFNIPADIGSDAMLKVTDDEKELVIAATDTIKVNLAALTSVPSGAITLIDATVGFGTTDIDAVANKKVVKGDNEYGGTFDIIDSNKLQVIVGNATKYISVIPEAATGNEVVVTDGTMATINSESAPAFKAGDSGYTSWKAVYGGYSEVADAKNNTVKVSGGDFSSTDFYGGKAGEGKESSGNTLEISGQSISVKTVNDFQNYTFTLPASVTGENPYLLQLTGAGDDFQGDTITVNINDSDAESITLISGYFAGSKDGITFKVIDGSEEITGTATEEYFTITGTDAASYSLVFKNEAGLPSIIVKADGKDTYTLKKDETLKKDLGTLNSTTGSGTPRTSLTIDGAGHTLSAGTVEEEKTKGITIGSGTNDVLIVKNLTISGFEKFADNSGKLTLEDVTFTGTTGTADVVNNSSGEITLKGAVTLDKGISGAGKVTNKGTITAALAKLGDNFTNDADGTLNLAGQLTGDIKGAGTTILGEDQTINTNRQVKGTLNGNFKTIDMTGDNTDTTLTVGNLAGVTNLKIDVDMSNTANVDTLKITAGAEEGAILNLSAINITKDYLVTGGGTITVPTDVKNGVTYVTGDGAASGNLTYKINGKTKAEGGSLQSKIATSNYVYTFTLGDTGKLNYSFTTVEPDNIFRSFIEGKLVEVPQTLSVTEDMADANADMGENTTYNTLNIYVNDGKKLGSAVGNTVALDDGDTINLNGGTSAAGIIYTSWNVAKGGTLNLSGKIDEQGVITNAGTLNLNSTYTSTTAITNTGTLNVTAANLKADVTNTDGKVNLGAGTLGDYTIAGGNIITTGNVTANVKNLKSYLGISNGYEMTLTGGTDASHMDSLQDMIDGGTSTDSVTIIDGFITSEKTITQHEVRIKAGKKLQIVKNEQKAYAFLNANVQNEGTLTINADHLVGDVVNSTEAVVELDSGDLRDYTITNGTLKIIGDVITNADNLKVTTVNNTGSIALTGGSLTVALAGTLSNSGELTTAAGNLGAALSNSGTVTLTGGELKKTITGGSLNITDDLIANANYIQSTINTVTEGKLLTLKDEGTLSQNLTGDIKNIGTLTITGTVTGKIDNDSTLNLNSTYTSDTAIDNDGTLNVTAVNLKADVTNTNGTVNLGAGELTKAVTGGNVNITGTVSADGNNLVNTAVTAVSGGELTMTGETYNGSLTAATGGIINLTLADYSQATSYDTTSGGTINIKGGVIANKFVGGAEMDELNVNLTSGSKLTLTGNGAYNSLAQYIFSDGNTLAETKPETITVTATNKFNFVDGGVLEVTDYEYTYVYLQAIKEAVEALDTNTKLTMKGTLKNVEQVGEATLTTEQAATIGQNVNLPQATVKVTGDPEKIVNTLIGSVTTKEVEVTGVEGEIKDKQAEGFNVNKLDLAEGSNGVVITNDKAVVLGGNNENTNNNLISVGGSDDVKVNVVVGVSKDEQIEGTTSTKGTLGIGIKGSTKEEGYKLNGNLTVNGESEVEVNADVKVTGDVTLDGGTLAVAENQTITINNDLKVANNTTVTGTTEVKETLTYNDEEDEQSSVIQVGNEKTKGTLSVKTIKLRNKKSKGVVFADPAWKIDQDNYITEASNIATESVNLDASYIAGKNSVIAFGTTNNTEAERAFAESRLTWGYKEDQVSAAVYVYGNVNLTKQVGEETYGGDIMVDGRRDFSPGAQTDCRLNLAENSLLMINGNACINDYTKAAIQGIELVKYTTTYDEETGAETGSANGVASTSKIYIANALQDETYYILQGVEGVVGMDSTSNWWSQDNIIINDILEANMDATGLITVDTSTYYRITTQLKQETPTYYPKTVASSVFDAMRSEKGTEAYKFLYAVGDTKDTSLTEAKKIAILNRTADLPEEVGVMHNHYNVTNMTEDAVAKHLALDEHTQGKEIWAQGIHSKEHVNGLGLSTQGNNYSTQYNGTVVGVDIMNNSKTILGAAITYIDGKATAAGSHNEGKYYGATLYGRTKLGKDAGVQYDVSYIHSSNDMTLASGCSYGQITGDQDVNSFSVGARLEQEIKAGHSTSFVPHVGARWLRMKGDSFTNSLGNSYKSDTTNSLIVPLGLSFKASMHSEGWKMSFLADAGYQWNTGDREYRQHFGYNGVNNSFDVNFADSNGWYAGAGLEFNRKNLTAGVSYRYSKSDSTRQNKWNVNLSWSF